jgi:hypothetical protein
MLMAYSFFSSTGLVDDIEDDHASGPVNRHAGGGTKQFRGGHFFRTFDKVHAIHIDHGKGNVVYACPQNAADDPHNDFKKFVAKKFCDPLGRIFRIPWSQMPSQVSHFSGSF